MLFPSVRLHLVFMSKYLHAHRLGKSQLKKMNSTENVKENWYNGSISFGFELFCGVFNVKMAEFCKKPSPFFGWNFQLGNHFHMQSLLIILCIIYFMQTVNWSLPKQFPAPSNDFNMNVAVLFTFTVYTTNAWMYHHQNVNFSSFNCFAGSVALSLSLCHPHAGLHWCQFIQPTTPMIEAAAVVVMVAVRQT